MNIYKIRVVENEYHLYDAVVHADNAQTKGGELLFYNKRGYLVAAFANWVYFKQMVEED